MEKIYKCSHPNCNEKFEYLDLVNGKTPNHTRLIYGTINYRRELISVECNWSNRSPIKIS